MVIDLTKNISVRQGGGIVHFPKHVMLLDINSTIEVCRYHLSRLLSVNLHVPHPSVVWVPWSHSASQEGSWYVDRVSHLWSFISNCLHKLMLITNTKRRGWQHLKTFLNARLHGNKKLLIARPYTPWCRYKYQKFYICAITNMFRKINRIS